MPPSLISSRVTLSKSLPCSSSLKGWFVDILQILFFFFCPFSLYECAEKQMHSDTLTKKFICMKTEDGAAALKQTLQKGMLLFLRAVYLLWPCKKNTA